MRENIIQKKLFLNFVKAIAYCFYVEYTLKLVYVEAFHVDDVKSINIIEFDIGLEKYVPK